MKEVSVTSLDRILAIREHVWLAAPTCNTGWCHKKTREFRESRLKYQLKHPEQYITVLCFFSETVIYPVSLWPENKTINYKDQLFRTQSRVDIPSWKLCVSV